MNKDIYDTSAKLKQIEEAARADAKSGPGPKFPGYWGAEEGADMARKRMVGDSKLRNVMNKIEEESADSLREKADILRQRLAEIDAEIAAQQATTADEMAEAWSEKYKKSIDCNNPRGFSQRAHCDGRKKNESTDIDVNDIDADAAAAEQAADEMPVNEAVTTEDKLGDKIVDKLQDMLTDLKADSKTKKDSDLHSKTSAEEIKKKLAPVMRAKFGKDGMHIAEICGNLDDGFVVVVNGREIGGNLPNITAARKALQELHTELANKPALEGADYVDEA